jgi:integrase/recombinase XerD
VGRPSKPWYRAARSEWYATVNGKQTPLGVTDPAALGAAWDTLKKLLAAGAGPGTPPPALPAGSAVAAFLAARSGRLKPHTLLCYSQHLRNFAAAVGGARDLTTLTAEEVEATADRPAWSPSTRNGYLGAVGTLLKAAGVPLKLRRPAKESRGADAVWTEQEFWQCYGAAQGDFKAVLLVLRDTGCRPSEAAGLTAEGVDWARGLARLRDHKTAGKGKARVLYFPEGTVAVLVRQRELHREGHLFRQDDGGPFTAGSLTRRMILCRERAGVSRPVTLYGLRHGFICRALEGGASSEQVAALVGNSPAVITSNYNHISQNAAFMRDLAERVKKTG